ncbi:MULTISPECIES: hypothetical protein [Weeksella]|nr:MULTISPECIES: hypothetical protein [Weeksella]MDK7375403.1 hypothetical protein [Weeksella virosa]MDK7676082.1 hypothetical protein [Weeksella virosa]
MISIAAESQQIVNQQLYSYLSQYYWLLIMAVVLLMLFSWLGSSKSKRK